MNATILPFIRKRRALFSSAWNPVSWSVDKNSGVMDAMPSLEEMCATLRKNYAVLDETDRSFLFLITRVCNMGNRAKIETVMGCRAFAWSMLGRYKLPC